jgi:hypothetical protein
MLQIMRRHGLQSGTRPRSQPDLHFVQLQRERGADVLLVNEWTPRIHSQEMAAITMTTETNQSQVPSIYRQDFEQVKDEIAAIPEQAFMHVSLDIPATVITTQGVYPKVIALREDFVRHLPTFDVAKVDKLETYALAMFCTQADYKAATEPPASVTELVNTAVATRAVLLADVHSLIAYDLLSPGVISGLQGTNGHKNVMMDLGTLASILRRHAAKVAVRTSVRPEELSAAEDLANKLGKALGLREQSPQLVAEVTRTRQAAFTLFVKTYDDVRAAVQYLRRAEGDADAIIPSLYLSRGLRKKAVEEAAGETAATATETLTSISTKPATTANTATKPPTAHADTSDGPFMHS